MLFILNEILDRIYDRIFTSNEIIQLGILSKQMFTVIIYFIKHFYFITYTFINPSFQSHDLLIKLILSFNHCERHELT